MSLMDTARLELAAQRYREAEQALDAARDDLKAEAVAALQQDDERGNQATVARITGWTREYVRRVKKAADEGAE
ncbi:hypothetical protein ACFVDT_06875 [Streptomyces sp. NPDC057699]|uniref:hypothetical protein n=1 Tax=Streptomyces sp. NPDC057699 TaxID=3346220 RepID=UPI00367A1ED3